MNKFWGILGVFSCLVLLQAETVRDKAMLAMQNLSRGNYVAVAITEDAALRQALPPAALEQLWRQVQLLNGNFLRILHSVKEKKNGEFSSVLISVEFERKEQIFVLNYNAKLELVGLFLGKSQNRIRNDNNIWIGGEWKLPGTLTLPEGKKPVPCVILVHGSGDNDRDETLGPNKPFAELSRGLAKMGIATLRYDKRSYVYPERLSKLTGVTVKDETIDDVELAVAALRQNPAIDSSKIFILGHSLGGMLMPRIARQAVVAGYIVMAGSAQPLEDSFLTQSRYLMLRQGQNVSPEALKGALSRIEAMRRNVKKLKQGDMVPRKDLFGAPASYWLDLKDYRPAEMAKNIESPMLFLQGGRDYQVTDVDWQIWRQALKDKPNVRFIHYESLNHLFHPGQGESTPDEYSIPGHIPEQVIRDIAGFVQSH